MIRSFLVIRIDILTVFMIDVTRSSVSNYFTRTKESPRNSCTCTPLCQSLIWEGRTMVHAELVCHYPLFVVDDDCG